MIQLFKDFSIVNDAEVDVFLKFPCFFYDPMDVSNLISGSSAFSKVCVNNFYSMQFLQADFAHLKSVKI